MRNPTLPLILCIVLLTGCTIFHPFALDPDETKEGLYLLNVVMRKQKKQYDCGEGALATVLNYWGYPATTEQILLDIFKGKPEKLGTTAKDLADYARSRGLAAFLIKMEMKEIFEQIRKGRPVIVCRKINYGINHYEVVIGYDKIEEYVIIANPARGIVSCSWENFKKLHVETENFALLVAPVIQEEKNKL